MLFNECKKMNENTYFIESADEIDLSVLTKDIRSIGIFAVPHLPKMADGRY